MPPLRGFLKSVDGAATYPLSPRTTSVGREGCDINLNSATVEHPYHAIIEFVDEENCYVLQDLNSSFGTYVNDCRIQNAAVRLASGDRLRFGSSSVVFEFYTETDSVPVTCPPIHQRPTWTQPLRVINETQVRVGRDPVPRAGFSDRADSVSLVGEPGAVAPHPPVRQRPMSTTGRPGATVSSAMGEHYRGTGAWAQNNGSSVTVGISVPMPREAYLLQEKEQKILKLQDEVQRLTAFEGESIRKDSVICKLRDELADLSKRLVALETDLRRKQTQYEQAPVDPDMVDRLMQLEAELQEKSQQAGQLSDELNRLREQQDSHSHEQELRTLKAELERIKKDKNVAGGLVSQLQRDMTAKDSTVSKLTREVESLRQESKEKDVHMSALSMKENKKADEEKEARDKELVALRAKFKATEAKLQEQMETIAALKDELAKRAVDIAAAKDKDKAAIGELKTVKDEAANLKHAEQLVRVEMESLKRNLSLLRSRLVGVAFSQSDLKVPDKELTDDELIDSLQKLVQERKGVEQKVKAMHDDLDKRRLADEDAHKAASKLKDYVADLAGRLKGATAASSSKVAHEASLLRSQTCSEHTQWVKDIVLELLQTDVVWLECVEKALLDCGLDPKLRDEDVGQLIRSLFEKGRQVSAEKEALHAELQQKERRAKEELEQRLVAQRMELEGHFKLLEDRMKRDFEHTLQQQMNALTSSEREEREAALEEAKVHTLEAEHRVAQLRQALHDQEASEQALREETKHALALVDEYKKTEASLRQQIDALMHDSSQATRDMAARLEDAQRVHETDVASYKEQIRQHSITICQMDERGKKLSRDNKELKAELTALKHKFEEQRKVSLKVAVAHPAPSTSAQQQVYSLEQTVVNLRREAMDYKARLQEQEAAILGLRSDLAGATARLSDVKGEMSEQQKRDMEESKVLSKDRAAELAQARSQLAKLSQIVDKQNRQVEALQAELSHAKSLVELTSKTADEKLADLKGFEARVAELQSEIEHLRAAQKEEGQITGEMTAAGAQCRGERHDQIIQRQREALGELRARVKALEQMRPPNLSQEQALQQVILLKKELAELRAQMALSSNRHLRNTDTTVIDLEDGHSPAATMKALVSAQDTDLEWERAAHRETSDALELSESAYLSLARGVASCLELEDMTGLRSMAHLPRDERERLVREREAAAELATSRVKVLKERLMRKDSLLQDYERDLAKLRQAEVLVVQKTTQLEELERSVRDNMEESQYLRETLNRTRDTLDVEKRLNATVKHKKRVAFTTEQAPAVPAGRKQVDQLRQEIQATRKAYNDRIRRKDYAIRNLQEQLHQTAEDLDSTSKELGDIRTTLMEPPGLPPREIIQE